MNVLKVLATSLLFAGAMMAQNSAVGSWQYVDGNRTTYITTAEDGGQLKATIMKVTIDGKEDPAQKCAKCSGENKDKPLVGMQILWDTKKDGNNWKEGKLIDPVGGNQVKGSVEVVDGGKSIKVKGSMGILSKTQTWTRVQ